MSNVQLNSKVNTSMLRNDCAACLVTVRLKDVTKLCALSIIASYKPTLHGLWVHKDTWQRLRQHKVRAQASDFRLTSESDRRQFCYPHTTLQISALLLTCETPLDIREIVLTCSVVCR